MYLTHTGKFYSEVILINFSPDVIEIPQRTGVVVTLPHVGKNYKV